MRDKITKTMKRARKYMAMGGALSLGAEGVSALVRYSEGSPNMQDSEKVEFTNWGPSLFRVDSVETAPKTPSQHDNLVTYRPWCVSLPLSSVPEDLISPNLSLQNKSSPQGHFAPMSPSLQFPCYPE